MWLHNIPIVTFCLIVDDSTNNFFWIVLEILFFFWFYTSHPAFVHFLLWRPRQDWRGCRLPDMWNSSSVNLSVPPYEPWPIIRCTWALPQTLTSAKTVSSSVQIRPVCRPPPRRSLIPSCPDSHYVVMCSPFSSVPFAKLKSLYICSTWRLLSTWPINWLASLLRSEWEDAGQGKNKLENR